MQKANVLFSIPVIIVIALGVFLSFYQLTESPPTWLDEGIITQVSRNIISHGEYGIQVAPDEFESASFVTVGYPLTYPIATAFDFFGTGILSARVVMALFILITLVSGFFFIKRLADKELALTALLLLTTFAPLYGHGKNVLGEVPGLAYLLLGLLTLTLISLGRVEKHWFLLSGVLLGLAMATKPLFLLLLPPSFLLALVFTRERERFINSRGAFLLFGMGSALLIWLTTHFEGGSLREIILLYSGNPESVPLGVLLSKNIGRFFTETQPLFFLVLFSVWFFSAVVRFKRRDVVMYPEVVALLFSLFSLLSYVTSVGYYRYFFPAQALALLFLPSSLMILARTRAIAVRLPNFMSLARLKLLVISVCALLAGAGLYVTQFHSWVGGHYGDTHAQVMDAYFGELSRDGKSVFFYQAPEALLFFPSHNYYQYLKINSAVSVGTTSPYLFEEKPDIVVIKGDAWKNNPEFSGYSFREAVDRYDILEKLK